MPALDLRPELPLTIARSSEDCPEIPPINPLESCFMDSSDIDYDMCVADRDDPHKHQLNFQPTSGATFFDAVQFFWLNNTLSFDRWHSTLNFHWDSIGKLKEVELSNYRGTILRTRLWYRDDEDQLEDLSIRRRVRPCLAVRRTLPGPADLMIVIDTSNSMETVIVHVRAAVAKFVNTLHLNEADIRLGLIGYKSGAADSPYLFVHNFSDGVFTREFDEFVAAVEALEASGGGSVEQHESAFDAVYTATIQDWRDSPVSRNILLIADDLPAVPDVIIPNYDAMYTALRLASIDHVHLYTHDDLFPYFHPLQTEPPCPGEFATLSQDTDVPLTNLFESIMLLSGKEVEISSSFHEDTQGVLVNVQTLRGTYGVSCSEETPTDIISHPVVFEGEGFECPDLRISEYDSTLSESMSEVSLHFDSKGLLKRVYHGGVMECAKNPLLWDRDDPPPNTCGVNVPVIQYGNDEKRSTFYLWIITFGPLGHYKRACKYAKFCGCVPTGESSDETPPGCPCKDLCLYTPTGCGGMIGLCPSTFDIDAWYAHKNEACRPSCTGLDFVTYTWSGQCCTGAEEDELISCMDGDRPPPGTSGYRDEPCLYRALEAVGGGCAGIS